MKKRKWRHRDEPTEAERRRWAEREAEQARRNETERRKRMSRRLSASLTKDRWFCELCNSWHPKNGQPRCPKEPQRAIAGIEWRLPAASGANNCWLEIGAELDKHLGAPLLKFTKQGEFAISDIDVIPDGTRCVAHCELTELGWTKWADGKPVDRKVGLVADGFVPVPKSSLPDRDEMWEIQDDGTRRDPWSFQMSVPVTRLDAGGETYNFVVGSKGGLRCLSALTRAYGKRIADGKPGSPVVELKRDSYKHRAYGKIFFPTMPIVSWTNDSGKPQTLAEDLNDEIPHDL